MIFVVLLFLIPVLAFGAVMALIWRGLSWNRRTVAGMPPVEYALDGSLGRARPIEDRYTDSGAGMLQAGVRNAEMSGNLSYRLLVAPEGLLLRPVLGGWPWYHIPRSDVASVDEQRGDLTIRLRGHAPIELRRYEGQVPRF